MGKDMGENETMDGWRNNKKYILMKFDQVENMTT